MRRVPSRTAALTTGLLTALTLVAAPALVGTGSAAPHARNASASAGHREAARPGPVQRRLVAVEGVVTAVAASASDTSTSVLTVRVKGGKKARTVAVTVDKDTVVRRHGVRGRSDVQVGDRLHATAFRGASGDLRALRVEVQRRPAARPTATPSATPVTDQPSDTSTATTSAG